MRKGRVITIVGPTASGKTGLGIALAKRLGSVVISGDAFQVYRGLDIGTAKVRVEEAQGVVHCLIDCLEPTEEYSAARFCSLAAHCIREENEKGRIPLLVGGTGLYIQSLLEGYTFLPRGEGRAQWRELYDREGREGLTKAVRRLYPHMTLPADPQRLIRLLETAKEGEETSPATKSSQLVYEGPVLGIRMNRELLYDRINERVQRMMSDGLEEEVRRLREKGVPETAQAFKGIGYKEMLPVLRGERTASEAAELIGRNTRRFAKRQMTWYRRMPYIHWTEQGNKSERIWYGETEDYIRSYFRGEM